jgi:UDP-glucose 4-epimerase
MHKILNKNKKILIVGGAGYIGSHMVLYLLEKGYTPIIYDNLSEGYREAILGGEFIKGDLDDSYKLREVFSSFDISAVMHFAAFCYVGESVKNPEKYYRNNVFNTYNLLNIMNEFHINKFIFSSSCATYGIPQKLPLTEDHYQNPINPYGNTKLIVEKILKDYDIAYNLKSISLRYFNASGADTKGRIGEAHSPETHIIPNVIESALGRKKDLKIFGNDYPTPDGTCIRDYIHVLDLAQAHFLALEKLFENNKTDFYNLGNGEGYSNNQIIQSVEKVSGQKVSFEYVERREGDPPILIGSSAKAIKELGWKPEFNTIDTIIETALNWHKNKKFGRDLNIKS